MKGEQGGRPWLQCEIVNGRYEFVREQDMDLIGQWCRENDCGRRMSFDQFRFETESQVTAFLLRWG